MDHVEGEPPVSRTLKQWHIIMSKIDWINSRIVS
ncbi:hypothetical protein NC653_037054 [Populus alba x Populus x berolinensis]|uniref:Uncharacterized protein n=1 Tax=Populus alba x Populus x berolinensis TaxID=444605 RepID=A0AAD6LN76_9ROSI|nr:hypothetical protein NC653_036734 [Populus alba x Populus x berolinensis]KAJ6968852.1 hypothetical protein NC653_036739 [Populus alba x Populus x berolinensis]KAJ6969266.1 hypothetical protein NC653_037054 [Populus alba x Populus x berolinensis]